MSPEEFAQTLAALIRGLGNVADCGVLEDEPCVVGVTTTDDRILFVKVEGDE